MTKTDTVSESWQTHGEGSLRGPVDVYRAVPENAVQTRKGADGSQHAGKVGGQGSVRMFLSGSGQERKGIRLKEPKGRRAHSML